MLKDCYKRSNPSQFRNLTVIDYNYWPNFIVVHAPLGRYDHFKSPNTHRLKFYQIKRTEDRNRHIQYYGLNCNKILGDSVSLSGNAVVLYKHGDPIFLNCPVYWIDEFWKARPSYHQCKLIGQYMKNIREYVFLDQNLLNQIKVLKKGETLESKYGVKPEFVRLLIKARTTGLLAFQQKYRKGPDFYNNVTLDRLERLFVNFGNEPYFKKIYNYAAEANSWSSVTYYCDYMNMRSSLIKAKRIKEKDWPVAPIAANIVKLHNKLTPIYNRYLDTLQANALKVSQTRYTKKYYQKAKAYEAHNIDFSVIACKNLTELITEGRELHHCVGSYTDAVSNGKEYILFLRRNKDIDTPFYTIDVTPEGEIRQIHGEYNCNISEEIQGFIDEWAKMFKLKFTENRVLCHL